MMRSKGVGGVKNLLNRRVSSTGACASACSSGQQKRTFFQGFPGGGQGSISSQNSHLQNMWEQMACQEPPQRPFKSTSLL